MNAQRNKKRRRRRARAPRESGAKLFAYPLRLTVIGSFASILIWLVLSKSLPFALAPTNPDLALWFNPNNPAALLVKAEQARGRLLQIIAQEIAAKKKSPSQAATNENSGQSPKATEPSAPFAARKALRNRIRVLSKRILRSDPLNATAYRLLGEVADEPAEIRKLMRAAIARSRHETAAAFWLLNDAFTRKSYDDVLRYADTVLRTRPQLSKYVMSYLLQIVDDAKGRSLVVRALASAPRWRSAFLATLSRNSKRFDTPLKIMIALKKTGAPLTARELKPYLDALIAKERAYRAYNAWLQFLPEAQLTTLGLIYNPGFERAPSGLPFDWQMKRPRNAIATLARRKKKTGGQALHITFSPGRVVFPDTSQTVILVPGRYRLSFDYRGTIKAKRGLRWRLRCRYGSRKIIGQSQMLRGRQPKWQRITVVLDIPDAPACRAQILGLIHDARSASEEFIDGDIWFDNLKIKRVEP